jgi:hypothetical protein
MKSHFFMEADRELLLRGLVVLAVGLVLYIIATGLYQWYQNRMVPQRTVEAWVTGKRAYLDEKTYEPTFIVIFQLVDGKRLELKVDKGTYRSLLDQQTGSLTYRGSCYLDFR